MVGKHHNSSEYQRSFKSDLPCRRKTYEAGIDYRHARRQCEHSHNTDAFIWDDLDSETDSDNSCGNGTIQKHTGLPLHQYKHEKFNRTYRLKTKQLEEAKRLQSATVTLQQRNVTQGGRASDDDRAVQVDVVDTLTDTDPRVLSHQAGRPQQKQVVRMRNKKIQTPTPRPYTPSDELDDDWEVVDPEEVSAAQQAAHHAAISKQAAGKKPQKPKKPVLGLTYKKPVAKPRPMSAPLGRPFPKQQQQQQQQHQPRAKGEGEARSPFVPYGFKDKEMEMSAKKTYNIRASAEIHSSALRALKRRQALIDKKTQLESTAPLRERRRRALFNEFNQKARRETAQWDTEYRSHYVGYQPTEYQRSLSATVPHRRVAEDLIASV